MLVRYLPVVQAIQRSLDDPTGFDQEHAANFCLVVDADAFRPAFRHHAQTMDSMEEAPFGEDTLADGVVLEITGAEDTRLTLGRADDNDVMIGVPSVSLSHLEMWRDGDDLVIVDLGSTNGTYVGPDQVREKDARRLPHAGTFQVGDVTLAYVDGARLREWLLAMSGF